MKSGDCAAVILSAGYSSRMSKPKPLLPLGSATVADHLIAAFLENDVRVYLVVGHRKDKIVHGIREKNINIVENPDYEGGMFTSVQAGVRSLRPGCEKFFVMPVDMPLVRPSTIARLMSESENHPDAIIYPLFEGRRGHPPLIPASLTQTVLEWGGEDGLKGILSAHNERAFEVVVPDGGVRFDVDTPEDYQELLKRYASIDIASEAERRILLNEICHTEPQTIDHCRKVAVVALALGKALQDTGVSVDTGLIRAAAELHDLLRAVPVHEEAGADLLRSYGFGRIGDIISVHMDMPADNSHISLESKIVFLADKLAEGTRLVSLEQRYDSRIRTASAEAAAQIEARKQRALKVKQEVESLLRAPLEQLILE